MKEVAHWNGKRMVRLVESQGGVLAAIDPLDNLVSFGVAPWPTPELLQKLYSSSKWKGKTPEDDFLARKCLGHYCDIQSLNSEDAITWSFFGPLIYGPAAWRLHCATALFAKCDLPSPTSIAIWLWRRIPHPEKPGTQGGPEIDFGFLSGNALLLGEAKWNSSIGVGQGIAGNRTQIDLRRAYCAELGRLALPNVSAMSVLGVGRRPDVLNCASDETSMIHNYSWLDLIECMPSELGDELQRYFVWKEIHSTRRQ